MTVHTQNNKTRFFGAVILDGNERVTYQHEHQWMMNVSLSLPSRYTLTLPH